MPPRYAYWTIIAGGLPTAFRAAEREELLPTFKRIQEKHPDAQMKYFARGKLWESREAAQAKAPTPESHRASEQRGRDWRPGGDHRDPRQGFIDAKKERNVERRKDRFARKNRPDTEQARRERPPGPPRGSWQDRPPRETPYGDPIRAK